MTDTVHIVDDDRPVRKSLRLLFESNEMRVRDYESAQDFLDRYEPHRPECLVLDLRMPGMDGMELQHELQRRDIEIVIVFLSGHGDIPIAIRTLREGAVDFVEKPFESSYLLDRVQRALRIGSERLEARIDQLEARKRLATLTHREQQVVDHLVRGKINKVIAADLGISMRTVEVHRSRITRKLGVDSLSDIIKLVLAAQGKLEPGEN